MVSFLSTTLLAKIIYQVNFQADRLWILPSKNGAGKNGAGKNGAGKNGAGKNGSAKMVQTLPLIALIFHF